MRRQPVAVVSLMVIQCWLVDGCRSAFKVQPQFFILALSVCFELQYRTILYSLYLPYVWLVPGNKNEIKIPT